MDEEEDEGSLAEGEEEYREVDPMQVIEDRLMLLEAWLHEDPQQEDVDQKREEYLSLLEELEILGKKMRKTDKLLALPNQPNVAKLESKRDQYEREVTDIVLYAEQDAFFDLEGENGEAALNAYMRANSLLGQPLETLAEMSGFEDSKAWNDSFGPLDLRSDSGSASGEASAAKSPSRPAQPGQSIANLDLSKPHNVTVLKKKLKKAKQMLEDTTSEKERKKLLKKITEYNDVLKDAVENLEDDESSDAGMDNGSEGSIEPPRKSSKKILPTLKQQDTDEYRTLKKKLTKATKLLQNASNPKDLQKFQKKVDEYLASLKKFEAWKQDQLAYGFGAGHSVEENASETEWMEQQAAADEERLAEEGRQHQTNQLRRNQAKSMLEASRKEKGIGSGETDAKIKPGSRHSNTDDSMDLETYIEEERKQTKILKKKLKKVEEMLDEKLAKEGNEARYTKEFRKLQKKRKQYLADLGEDHESLANVSLGGSMDTSFNTSSLNLSGHGSVDISVGDLGYNGTTPEGVCSDEREYRSQQEELARERQARRHERLEVARAQQSSSKVDENNPDIELLRKKLKKLDKMLKDTKPGSKDHDKLRKKRGQYLAELGEDA